MIVYKLTDRVPVAIGGVIFWLSPMSYEQKMKLMSYAKMSGGLEVQDGAKMSIMAIKFSVKDVDGLVDSSGDKYKLEFDSDGTLTDECASELLQVEAAPNLIRVATDFVTGIKDPNIEGVVVDLKAVRNVKKNPVSA